MNPIGKMLIRDQRN